MRFPGPWPSLDRRFPTRVVAVLAALVGAAVAAAAAAPVAAHGTPEEAVYHSLTVAPTFPDAGLAPDEQLCLTLFAGDDADLAAPLQTQCLLPGATSVTFDGLPHGLFRVAVPAPGSVLVEERYEGRVAETQIPDDPDVASYLIDLPLALLGEVAGTTGTIAVSAYVCPAGTSVAGDPTAWAAACPGRGDGIVFTLAADASLSAESTTVVTDAEGVAAFPDLPAGGYSLSETPLANVAPGVAWFWTSSFDGVTAPLEPGATINLRPAETVTVSVFHVLVEATVPQAAPPVDPAGGGVQAAIGTGPEAATPEAATAEATATPEPVNVNVAPVVSIGGNVQSGIEPEPTPSDAVPRITTLPSTGGGLAPVGGHWRGLIWLLGSGPVVLALAGRSRWITGRG